MFYTYLISQLVVAVEVTLKSKVANPTAHGLPRAAKLRAECVLVIIKRYPMESNSRGGLAVFVRMLSVTVPYHSSPEGSKEISCQI